VKVRVTVFAHFDALCRDLGAWQLLTLFRLHRSHFEAVESLHDTIQAEPNMRSDFGVGDAARLHETLDSAPGDSQDRGEVVLRQKPSVFV
jgi:hypothetical protein